MNTTKETATTAPPPTTITRPSLLTSESARLSTTNMFFGIPSNDEAKGHVEEEHGEESWRYQVVAFIHRPLFQKLISGLLVLDIVLLFIELFLLATYPHCSLIERDGLSCTAAADGDDEGHFRFLASSSDHHEPLCEHGYEWNGMPAGCDEHKWSTVHSAESVIFALTIFILSTFFVELTVEMVALTPAVFFRQFWFLLDYVIITISLVLEIAFHIQREAIYESLVGVLVMVRIWRFVRIGHGIVEVTHENVEEGRAELLEYVEELEKLLKANNVALPLSEKSVHKRFKDHTAHLLETIKERDSDRDSVRFGGSDSVRTNEKILASREESTC